MNATSILSAAIICLPLAVMVILRAGLVPGFTVGAYEETTLTVTDDEGNIKSTLTTTVADTEMKRYVGLSNTQSLEENRGMVFVYDTTAPRKFVMRRMNFGLDIIYIGSEGKITTVQSVESPSRPLEYYLLYDGVTGDGQYAIEVTQGWAKQHDVQPGDFVSGLPQP